MKYFGIIDKNVAAIFQLQWKIGNISDMFLQYFVLCWYRLHFRKFKKMFVSVFDILFYFCGLNKRTASQHLPYEDEKTS